MTTSHWKILAVLLICSGVSSPIWAQSNNRSITGRWLGQDSHDYCGAITNAIKPNGVQDIHIALAGLPPRRTIVFISITGYGADEWQVGGVQNQFGAMLVRKPGGITADLYFEALRVEKGRSFNLKMRFSDGQQAELDVKGGTADPNLKMPGAGMTAKWLGQVNEDHAGSGPSVGPDGLVDVGILLTKLSSSERPRAILVEDPGGSKWAYGINPDGFHNAEFLVEGKEPIPTQGTLYFHPDRNLAGRKLKVTVTYPNGKPDLAVVLAARCDPKLAMPKLSVPLVSAMSLDSKWIGHDGSALNGPGDVHVLILGIPARPIAAAVLSDPLGSTWVYKGNEQARIYVEAGAGKMTMLPGIPRGAYDLFFPPTRDETNTPMTLRVVFADGKSAVGTIKGGACDPSAKKPLLKLGEAVASNAAELLNLVDKGGTIHLVRGDYRLKKPLVLNEPVTIVGEPGAVLTFAQSQQDLGWTTAIKIHKGGTTLRGFAVRFDGPVKWLTEVSWGHAVIGTTDNFDQVSEPPKVSLVFDQLDIEGPQPAKTTGWEEGPKLMRLLNTTCGQITNNRLRGGPVECFGGPWRIEGNTYLGTPPATSCQVVFAVHDPHDVTVKNNTAKPVAPQGKTWRFLLFTQRGGSNVVENNEIAGIGPRDDDTIPSANAPEIFLTESYHIRFEGKPATVSDDRRVIKVHQLPGEAPRSGDVVSVLSGPSAGQWRRIAQRLDPNTYLLEAPLPAGTTSIEISPGFVNDIFSSNSIDAMGGSGAAGFVLAGNQFGCKVLDNRVKGAGMAFQIMAMPSESPHHWGWSHVPFLGGVFDGNTIEDSEQGAVIGVPHGGEAKTNKGRVYMTMSMKGNTVRWSQPFLSQIAKSSKKVPFAGITLGYAGSFDPAELIVEQKDNRLDAPPRAPETSALKIHAAFMNGQAVTKRALGLPTTSTTTSAGTAPRGADSGRTSQRR